MLDQIAADYPGRVAVLEWHVNSNYPSLYCAEAYNKWHGYPPPYYQGGGWYYATPWAWIDGRSNGNSAVWPGSIEQEMDEPSPVMFNITGTYNPANRQGTVQVEVVNEAPEPITGTLQMVITEDSINYNAPNGDEWHNHVARDYVPNQNGTSFTAPASGRDTFEQNYTLGGSWVPERCNVVVYFQNPTLQPDSSKPVHAGGMAAVSSFSAVTEQRPVMLAGLHAGPNPCRGVLSIRRPVSDDRQALAVRIRDVAGRIVQEAELNAGAETRIDLRGQADGVYFVTPAGSPSDRIKVVLSR